MSKGSNLFLIWGPFQRRSETLASIFNLNTKYYHFSWEEKNKLLKSISYIPKFICTLGVLLRNKPKCIFVQLAPTPLLYAVAIYKIFSGCMLVSDCHNTMIYDDHWILWPFAKSLLRWSDLTLVHNDDVKKIADDLRIKTFVLRDPLPIINASNKITHVSGIKINDVEYIIIPCGIAADEPLEELFGAIYSMPDSLFLMTWFKEKLPAELRIRAPDNLIFTGYLREPEFNALFAKARSALVLTTREGTQPSGASEAISLGVPLIISDIKTTRRLYGDAPVFVYNTIDSIARGIQTSLKEHAVRANAIASLRQSLSNESEAQINAVKQLLNICI